MPASRQQQEEDKLPEGGVRQLTNIELIRKAEESAESLDLEKAVALYEEGLERFPNDTVILDGYSELLIQLGEEEKAIKVSSSNIFKYSDVALGKVNLVQPSQGWPQVSKLCRDPDWRRLCPNVSQRH